MIDPKRRQMFTDLYRLAEFYERPPFQPGDIEENARWFEQANAEQFVPFCEKYPDDMLAFALALAVLDDANRQAVMFNRMESVL